MLDIETKDGPVSKLMAAFKKSLVHDLDGDGFADMYAQTIAYGLLSARVARSGTETADDVATAMPVTNPFLKELMETFLHVGGRRGKPGDGAGLDFDELGVNEVVELLDAANMEAVVRDFGDRNPREDPVIHFYELFLKEYDAKKRMQRGVFYTPRPIVTFIVRSLDKKLRNEFDLVDGFADITTWGEMIDRHKHLTIPQNTDPSQPFVQILDPATGTGTFLVEVIDVIHKTLMNKWRVSGDKSAKVADRWNEYVAMHLLPRLHGYELMMAPYAIAHMKIGLKLLETGYRFGSNERARVYLTNSLEPAHDFFDTLDFAVPALAHEAEAVNEIKRNQRFTVVLGNPPYSGESANKIATVESDVKATYQTVDGVPLREKGKKNWLLDDYVKFLRKAHIEINRSGLGLIGMITNNAYQDNPTFRGLRHSLLQDFCRIGIVDLHGSGKRSALEGAAEIDENVFDILQGVAIIQLDKVTNISGDPVVLRTDIRGARKSKYDLLETVDADVVLNEQIHPKADQWYFIAIDLTNESEWSQHVSLVDAFPVNGNGLISAKDHFAYAFSDAEFRRKLSIYLDPDRDDDDVRAELAIKDNSMWNLPDARARLSKEYSESLHCKVSYRPFDDRFSLFHHDVIFNLRRPVTRHIVFGNNLVLLATRMTKGAEWRHCFVTRLTSDCAFLSNKTSTNAFVFPLYTRTGTGDIFAGNDSNQRANLSKRFIAAMEGGLGVPFSSADGRGPLNEKSIFAYIYALLHSHSYRNRYGEFLKLEFPRIPLITDIGLFRALADLGNDLIHLHLLDSPMLNENESIVVGSGPMRVEKVSYAQGTVWLDANQSHGFGNVSENVWNFQIGSYQVCSKWLKDRQAKGGRASRPGRSLTDRDVEHYQKLVTAIGQTIKIMGQVDDLIDEYGGWSDALVGGADDAPIVQRDFLEAAENGADYDIGGN